ncbi:hypothetical protein JTE90_023918 [Oedothorax gibbosus]|uniref:Uncharacterized protein n=1 Tax=Oedothorax gibbosus TaxID=931172 RepID=A0AAV6ULI0_9ARAC|nr:hypothetical protein JTE90_023918 [Oedothorax gibbosus]
MINKYTRGTSSDYAVLQHYPDYFVLTAHIYYNHSRFTYLILEATLIPIPLLHSPDDLFSHRTETYQNTQTKLSFQSSKRNTRPVAPPTNRTIRKRSGRVFRAIRSGRWLPGKVFLQIVLQRNIRFGGLCFDQ